MIIDLPRFLAAGRPYWAELEKMLQRLETEHAYVMTLAELRRFHWLYQRASADLAKIQTFANRPEIYGYLDMLTARAYAEIHETRDRGLKPRVLKRLLNEFPRAFRRHVRAFQLSLLITVVGALFGAGAVGFDKDAKRNIFPRQFSHLYGDPAERVREEEKEKGHHLKGAEASFSASLMFNNIRVSILALALGMTMGFGTIVLLFYNGVILGAVILDYVRAGQTPFLLGWLLPHGVIEIPAVLIAGQAGLIIGQALLGGAERTTVRDRLRALGPDLIALIGGTAAMLVWAGIIEAFFSQLHQPVIPYAAKIAFGCAELGVLVWFLHWRSVEEEADE